MNKEKKICLIIGYPAIHSLSPVIHNAAYKALGIDDQYVFEPRDVRPEELKDFIGNIKGSNIAGLSVTTPHKQTVMDHLDKISDDAQAIGAVNTIVHADNELTGHNTDWIGALEPLRQMGNLKDKKVAVIGAGGAAKAFIYGLTKDSAQVTVFNRTKEKAKELAERFNCSYSSLEDQSQIKNYDIICNATSVGFAGGQQKDSTPIDPVNLSSSQIVFESIYSPLKTPLIKAAEAKGCEIILGTEMLLCQGFAQFKLFTGREAPEEDMRKALGEYLNGQ